MTMNTGAAEDAPASGRRWTDPACFTTVKELGRLVRSDGATLVAELQRIPSGPPILSLRVFDGSGEPFPGRGFMLRSYEIAPMITWLVDALDVLRERERARRVELECRRERARAARRVERAAEESSRDD